MSAAVKTLALLEYFSPTRPEIGLVQMHKLAKRDKATTYRHLQCLEAMGFVEQNPVSKQYRLGPALLHLAQMREATVPRRAGVEGPLRALADETGETAHVSVLSGKALHALTAIESPRHSIRVVMDITVFPLHATAAGMCALAFGDESLALFETACDDMTAFTPDTVTDPDTLRAEVDATRASGFGRAVGSRLSDVHSIAAPLFDQGGAFAGAVSVASVPTRMTPELEDKIRTSLIAASRAITHNWGGAIPDDLEQIWEGTLSKGA